MDHRVPLVFGPPLLATPQDALLIEGQSFQAGPPHPAGCACCGPRNPAGRALAALLQARARGEVPFFTRVIAVAGTPAGQAMIEAALAHDPVASACFRQADALA